MITFLKANVASLVATVIDYGVTIGLVSFFSFNPVAASIVGTSTGGIVNFLVGRYWAFAATEAGTLQQAARYFVVWSGNLLLNAGAMYLLTKSIGINYMVAKLSISTIVAFGYNYPLQKHFVFRKN